MCKKIHLKKICAVMLSACIVLSNSMITDVKAEDVKADVTEENTGREYVILAEDESKHIVEQIESGEEVVSIDECVVYEADLSTAEIKALERKEVQVEENIFLFGADSGKKEESKQKQLEMKRKLAKEYFMDDAEEMGTDWNYQMIRSDSAEEPETEGSVKVAILDSGIELLAGIPVSGSVNLVDEETDLPYYMNDMTGHGTAVADIVHQICPQAQIYAVRVLDKDNKGRLSDIVEGIYWCIDHDIDIINMSFGTWKESEILQSAIREASSKGIMIVGSAGNGGEDAGVEYPAAFEEVIAVGAVDTSAKRTDESATGPEIELVAPGEQIRAKSIMGLETVSSGTSMAAPHVTGAAAVLMEQNEEKNAEEIREVLAESGNPLGDTKEYGNGLVDVAYAQELLEETTEECATVSSNSVSENTIDENKSRPPVETFEDVDYVEGRWRTSKHEDLMEAGAKEYGDFTTKEINILKAGAAYPDNTKSKLKGAGNYPEWHGYFTHNYVANFIFATKIAQAGGKTSGLSKVRYQSTVCYERMKSAISTSGIQGVTWDEIFDTCTGYDYSAQSASTKKWWRQLFLYGMAAHTATDVFSHSSAYKDKTTGEYITLDHGGLNDWADEVNKYPNRYKCAGLTAFYVAWECQEKEIGDVFDFSAYGYSYWKGFYLKEVLYYANRADNCYGTKWLKEEYEAVDYSTKPIEWVHYFQQDDEGIDIEPINYYEQIRLY